MQADRGAILSSISMIPLQTLSQTSGLDGRTIELRQRGAVFYLYLDRYPLISSQGSACEDFMVIKATEHVSQRRKPRILLDGLGLGSLLQKVLQSLRQRAEIHVGESSAELLEWHQTLLGPEARSLITDERVTLEPTGTENCLAQKPDFFDTVVFDLDFSVTPFLRKSRSPRECQTKLALVRQALRPGGRIVMRSIESEPAVVRVLQDWEIRFEEHWVSPSKAGKGRRQCILVATLPFSQT